MRSIEESRAFVRIKGRERVRRRRAIVGISLLTASCSLVLALGVTGSGEPEALSLAATDGAAVAADSTTEQVHQTAGPTAVEPIVTSSTMTLSTATVTTSQELPTNAPPASEPKPSVEDPDPTPGPPIDVPTTLGAPPATAAPPTTTDVPPADLPPQCGADDLEFLDLSWGPLYVLDPYPPEGAPRPEPTRFGYSVRSGDISCRTTDSDEILEVSDTAGRIVYRVAHRDATAVITAPGRWLSFLSNAPWDPTCRSLGSPRWTIETCTAVGAGTYRATVTSHGAPGRAIDVTIMQGG